MAIELTCAECERDLRVRDELAGRTIKCPECGGAIEVPAERRRRSTVAAGAPARPKPRRDYDDDADRPRKKKKRKPSNNGLIIGLIIGGVLLLGGGATLIIVLTSESGNDRKGGGGFGPGPGARPGLGGGAGLGGHTVDREDLRQIAIAFHNHCDAKRGPPRSAADLVPFFEKQSAIAPLTDGRLVFNYNVDIRDMIAGTSNTVLAYERDAAARGGLVVFGDGSVRPVDAGEFAGLEQARPRKK